MLLETLLIVVLVLVILSPAAGDKAGQCGPTPPYCLDLCSDALYYLSSDDDKCEPCITCPVGFEPDRICGGSRGQGEGAKCIPCKSGHFSTEENQFLCTPCKECDVNYRLTKSECTATNNRECGDCRIGYGFDPDLDLEFQDICSSCEYLHPDISSKQASCTITSKPSTIPHKTSTTMRRTSTKPSWKPFPTLQGDLENERNDGLSEGMIAYIAVIALVVIALILAALTLCTLYYFKILSPRAKAKSLSRKDVVPEKPSVTEKSWETQELSHTTNDVRIDFAASLDNNNKTIPVRAKPASSASNTPIEERIQMSVICDTTNAAAKSTEDIPSEETTFESLKSHGGGSSSGNNDLDRNSSLTARLTEGAGRPAYQHQESYDNKGCHKDEDLHLHETTSLLPPDENDGKAVITQPDRPSGNYEPAIGAGTFHPSLYSGYEPESFAVQETGASTPRENGKNNPQHTGYQEQRKELKLSTSGTTNIFNFGPQDQGKQTETTQHIHITVGDSGNQTEQRPPEVAVTTENTHIGIECTDQERQTTKEIAMNT